MSVRIYLYIDRYCWCYMLPVSRAVWSGS